MRIYINSYILIIQIRLTLIFSYVFILFYLQIQVHFRKNEKTQKNILIDIERKDFF